MRKVKPLFRLDAEDYIEQKQEMVDELVKHHLSQSIEEIMLHYKEFLYENFHGIDDDSLQNCHDDIFTT